MTLQIPLSPESEARLRSRAAALGKDPAIMVRDMIEDELTLGAPAEEENRQCRASAEKRIRALREWAASHRPLPYEADDSRESIYEGRGE